MTDQFNPEPQAGSPACRLFALPGSANRRNFKPAVFHHFHAAVHTLQKAQTFRKNPKSDPNQTDPFFSSLRHQVLTRLAQLHNVDAEALARACGFLLR
jgi:hypothetical protein